MDRNFLLAIVLSMGVLLGWELLISGPQRQATIEARREAAAAAQSAPATEIALPGASAISASLSIDEALAAAPGRVPIDTPTLEGSINLAGARIDDLKLKGYRETIDPASPIIRLLSPAPMEHGHYMQQGWSVGGAADTDAVWTAPDGARLTPATPVTFTRRAGGVVFEKTISVDENYMFEVEQTVRNETAAPIAARPYALVFQRGVPNDLENFMILHEGPVAVVGESLFERKYKRMIKDKLVEAAGETGWVGITNKYWLAAALPPQGSPFEIRLANTGTQTAPVFNALYTLPEQSVAPGASASVTSHLYGGAKNVDTLRSYQKPIEEGGLGVKGFDRAVDWGNFWFLTRPIFATLDFFGDLTGNFGVSILILTLIIKLLMFPLANRAFEMTAKMKKIQPQLEAVKARVGDDKVKLQQEMMALYQKEKLNPLAGCLPILIQMPIFYALYKTLFVTIELRHEPFMLWIRDLSAPDPTTIFNLFGLIPYDPLSIPVIGSFLGIGVLPLLMGVSMWFQLKLNPPPADPIQAQIFSLMPILFTFLFAPFAAGLVIYWFWNTLLSIFQQMYIMKRNGVAVDWKTNLGLDRLMKKQTVDGK